jgi:AraC-like DNA-binding protein
MPVMQSTAPTILLLHDDPFLHHSLRSIGGRPYAVEAAGGWQALATALGRPRAATVALVDPFHDSTPDEPAPALRRLLDDGGSPVVLAAFAVTPERSGALRTLLAWGVADVLDLPREASPALLERRLRRVRGRRVHHTIARALPRGVPGRARAVLDVAADVVAMGGQSPELAAALGVHERTVPRWCARVGLPPPRRVLAWLRLLCAAELLEGGGPSTEAVARACGYAGAASLKSALQNLVGLSPRDLRRPGAFAALADRFERELFEVREQLRSSGMAARTVLA